MSKSISISRDIWQNLFRLVCPLFQVNANTGVRRRGGKAARPAPAARCSAARSPRTCTRTSSSRCSSAAAPSGTCASWWTPWPAPTADTPSSPSPRATPRSAPCKRWVRSPALPPTPTVRSMSPIRVPIVMRLDFALDSDLLEFSSYFEHNFWYYTSFPESTVKWGARRYQTNLIIFID